MTTFFTSIIYVFLFLTFYLQVFLLLTFFEERKSMKKSAIKTNLSYYPSITMIIPCWNEEKTVEKTVNSLLTVDYPKDKLKIFVVDDGSTDKSWKIMQKFAENPQVTLLQKENGGKHTALNMAIVKSNTELIGCLDADSFMGKNALIDLAHAFNEDPNIMAASPVLVVSNPQTIIQKMQKVEYQVGAFLKRMFSPIDAITVVPGPGTIFRKEVFEKIGLYKKANNTEDGELTLRMQSNHMRIRNVHTAHVYTTSMPTFPKLYKQRVRWSYGNMKNTLDYRFMMFNKKYGTFGLMVLPLYFFSNYILLYNFFFFAFHFIKNMYTDIIKYSVTGFSLTMPKFDLFYFNTDAMRIMFYITLSILIFTIWRGMKISEGRFRPNLGIFYFFILYGFMAPIWLSKSVFNLLISKDAGWR